jgi:hypothetical protein
MKLFPTEHALQQEVELMKHTSVGQNNLAASGPIPGRNNSCYRGPPLAKKVGE